MEIILLLVGVVLAPQHLGRYRDFAKLFLKYGRSDIIRNAGLADTLMPENSGDHEGEAPPDELASDLEKLGPTYVKFGQLLSTRPDLLPDAYIESLSRLQDGVAPFPSEQAVAVIEEDLGVKYSRAFATFDLTPLAAASLGQVHRATLRDGTEVVVKVQRPGIRDQIREDLDALKGLAQFLDAHTDFGKRLHLSDLVDELGRTLARELDYQREAANLRLFRHNLAEFEHIVIPAPVPDLSGSRVLTMERIEGHNISKLNPVVHLELDGETLCEELFHAYLKQVLVDGVFHADPHPGNVLVTSEGKLALIDLGMTGHVSPGLQEKLMKFVLGIAQGAGEDVAELALSIGTIDGQIDRRAFKHDVAQLVALERDKSISETATGRIVVEITRLSSAHGIRQPSELTLLGKAFLNLDKIAATLAPKFNPSEAVQRHATGMLRRKLLGNASVSGVVANALELNEFVQRLPGRVNRFIERVTEDEFEIRVKTIDEVKLIAGLEKIANRITLGLVLAALIVGAALLMRVESSFRVLGYPVLPIVFFLCAALGGVVLIHRIVSDDEKHTKSR